MPGLDADEAERHNGDEFRDGAHEVFERLRGRECRILFVVDHVEEDDDSVNKADSYEREGDDNTAEQLRVD